LAVGGSELSASHPGHCFIPRVTDPGTHRIGGWVGPRAGLELVMKKKKSQHGSAEN